jgi:phage regulator Rha-like protein
VLDAEIRRQGGRVVAISIDSERRNVERFLSDFMFRLTDQEFAALRSQTVTAKPGRGGRRTAPYAITEQGVAMLSSVLNSPQAVQVNIGIVRAFVRLREALASNRELAAKFEELARKVDTHDQAIAGLLRTLRELMNPPPASPKRPIGFVWHDGAT